MEPDPISKWLINDLTKERDQWKEIALRLIKQLDDSVNVETIIDDALATVVRKERGDEF